MKKHIFTLLAVLILLSLVWIPTVSVGATLDQTIVCSLETDYAKIPGTVWFSENGTRLHIRGQTTYSNNDPLPGHPECDTRFTQGKMWMTVNLDLDLATGKGNAWGYTYLSPAAFEGQFVGPFEGKIQGYVFTGTSVTRGTGDLKGVFEKVTIQQTGENTYEVHGIVYAP